MNACSGSSNDLDASEAAGSPRILTLGFGVVTAIFAAALVMHAVGAFVSRRA